MTQKFFRDEFGKPSAVLRALVAGLEYPRIKIDMTEYGKNSDGIPLSRITRDSKSKLDKEITCGCAVPAVVLEKFPERKRDYANLYLTHDLLNFRRVINDLRRGFPANFFSYFDVPDDITFETMEIHNHLPPLNTLNYEDGLFQYENLAEKLEELGV